MEKIRVTLTLMPSAIEARMAGTPAAVAGILMKTLGRARASNSRRVSRMVVSVSSAMSGGTSKETRPSTPPVRCRPRPRHSAAGRALEDAPAVAPAGALPHRLQLPGGGVDVVEGQGLEDGLGVAAGGGQGGDVVVVERPLPHGLLEDGRVGGDADDLELVAEAAQLRLLDPV